MKKVIYALLTFSPVLALAQAATPTFTGIGQLFTNIKTNVFGPLVAFLFALAVIYFFWGLVNFIRASGDPKAQEAGRSQMIWGIVAIAVMVSVYGLVNWITGTLSLSNATITIPPLPNAPAN